jgi:hypothetical protein
LLGAERKDNGKLWLKRYRVSVCHDKKVLEINTGDGYTTL